MEQPLVRAFFDEATNTVSYLVWDPATKKARSSIRCWTGTTVLAKLTRPPPML